MCVRYQYWCVSSPSPEGNISMFVGPVFQLESPTSEQNLPAFLWHYEKLLACFQFQRRFSSLCGLDITLSAELTTEGRVQLPQSFPTFPSFLQLKLLLKSKMQKDLKGHVNLCHCINIKCNNKRSSGIIYLNLKVAICRAINTLTLCMCKITWHACFTLTHFMQSTIRTNHNDSCIYPEGLMGTSRCSPFTY